MILLIVGVIFSLFATSTSLNNVGGFSWNNKGSTINAGLAADAGCAPGISVSGGSVTLKQQYQPRAYLMTSTSPTSYYRFPDLRGNSIRATIDLHQTTCGCNAAFYLVDIPAGQSPGSYCDAQSYPPCAEYDIIEANTHAFQATVHIADGQNPGHWGCAWNVKSGNGYGPGGSNIDTTKPFTVDFAFSKSSSGTLNGIRIKLSQSGKSGLSTSLTDSSCSSLTSNYITQLDASAKAGRLVAAFSYWGGGMDWLDGCSSGATCPTSSTVTFSSVQVISGLTAATADEVSQSNDQPFVQSPVFVAIMCSIGILLLVGLIAFVLIRRKNALSQEIV